MLLADDSKKKLCCWRRSSFLNTRKEREKFQLKIHQRVIFAVCFRAIIIYQQEIDAYPFEAYISIISNVARLSSS